MSAPSSTSSENKNPSNVLARNGHSSRSESSETQILKCLKFDEGFCQWLPPAAYLLRKQQLLSMQGTGHEHYNQVSTYTTPSNSATSQISNATNDSHSGGGTTTHLRMRKDTIRPYKFAHMTSNSDYIKQYREQHNCTTYKMHRKDLEMYHLLVNDMSSFYDKICRNKHGGASIINGQIYFRQDEMPNGGEGDRRRSNDDSGEKHSGGGVMMSQLKTTIPSMQPLQRTRSIPHYKQRGYYQMPFFNITGKVLKMMPREFEDGKYEE